MTSYITSFIYYISDIFREKLGFFKSKEIINHGNIIENDCDIENLKPKSVSNDITKIEKSELDHLNIKRMYELLDRYNPVVAKTKNFHLILHFIKNEIKYEEKLSEFENLTETADIVEKIEKMTILNDLYNQFNMLKKSEKTKTE